MIDEKLADMYRNFIEKILRANNVREIECHDEKEHFFDRVVIKANGIEVYSNGLSEPCDNFYFDFSIDFSTMLKNIEHDLYLAMHHSKPEHGMKFKFNN